MTLKIKYLRDKMKYSFFFLKKKRDKIKHKNVIELFG